ncbi:MAG TPA: dihydroxyacetone kinase subunit DhaK [Caldilineaceae bacterium]|nr:dihydroxyacetone kinase subunit DhaK [Caldilineaceae bacterium]
MKKLINGVDDVVVEQLEGMALAHPELNVNISPHYITRGDAPVAGKVAIVSGGGSGHEPMHGGFVGMGMLTGACPGEVFTSPTPDQMVECGKAVDSGAGVLFLVKNYTGDVLSFETAADMLHMEGINVQNILIDDDVAVKDSLYTAGRRGVGATVIVEKIVGAAAEAGYDLDQCADLARKVSQNGRSMGMALTSCVTPSKGSPIFDLSDDEIEIGVGIHGEPGMRRIKMRSADEITAMLANEILDDGPYTRTVREFDRDSGEWVEKELTDEPLQSGDEVIAFVNSLGGTPLSELYAVYRKLAQICEERGVKIVRNLIGPYITSLEMQGCSITLVKVDEEILKFWDAPVNTPALRWGA